MHLIANARKEWTISSQKKTSDVEFCGNISQTNNNNWTRAFTEIMHSYQLPIAGETIIVTGFIEPMYGTV